MQSPGKPTHGSREEGTKSPSLRHTHPGLSMSESMPSDHTVILTIVHWAPTEHTHPHHRTLLWALLKLVYISARRRRSPRIPRPERQAPPAAAARGRREARAVAGARGSSSRGLPRPGRHRQRGPPKAARRRPWLRSRRSSHRPAGPSAGKVVPGPGKGGGNAPPPGPDLANGCRRGRS